jgi:ANTAR domain
MYVYSMSPRAAVDLLKWRSQEDNVKLRPLAEQLVADIATFQHDADELPSRPIFDRVLLTAHQRVKSKGAEGS